MQRLFLARACVSEDPCSQSEGATGAALAAPEWAHCDSGRVSRGTGKVVLAYARPTAAWNKGIVRKGPVWAGNAASTK